LCQPLRGEIQAASKATSNYYGADTIASRELRGSSIAGLCLEVHDLAIPKFVAGRHKDLEFIQELIRREVIRKKTMLTRLAEAELQDAERSRISLKSVRELRSVGKGN